jgi:hypothetical protein
MKLWLYTNIYKNDDSSIIEFIIDTFYAKWLSITGNMNMSGFLIV